MGVNEFHAFFQDLGYRCFGSATTAPEQPLKRCLASLRFDAESYTDLMPSAGQRFFVYVMEFGSMSTRLNRWTPRSLALYCAIDAESCCYSIWMSYCNS